MSTEAATGVVERSRAFVQAVVWGEHHRVWDMLSADGRKTVLRVAVSRGMDEALASRLRDGTATDEEREPFLRDLVNGLRADLQGGDVDTLEYVEEQESPAPGVVRVVLRTPLPEILGGGGLPAGYVELTRGDAGWQVERLVKRVAT